MDLVMYKFVTLVALNKWGVLNAYQQHRYDYQIKEIGFPLKNFRAKYFDDANFSYKIYDFYSTFIYTCIKKYVLVNSTSLVNTIMISYDIFV